MKPSVYPNCASDGIPPVCQNIQILNATKPIADVAFYLPVSEEEQAWGIRVRGIGRITNAPRAPYPPAGHPDDHAFDWRHGRVLGAWQVVLVIAGEGECEFERGGGVRRVAAGSVIVIVPGQWHRYRPGGGSGWRELWIEFDGETPRRLTEAGLLPRRGEVRPTAAGEALAESWAAILRAVESETGPAESAALMLRLLGLLTAREGGQDAPLARAVRRATHILEERLADPPTMPELARAVGVSYAVFRREFRRRTGVSPRRHLLQLRLERARRLVGSTPMRLEAIAEQTGFGSAFHLSAAFKQRFGVAPSAWRRGLM